MKKMVVGFWADGANASTLTTLAIPHMDFVGFCRILYLSDESVTDIRTSKKKSLMRTRRKAANKDNHLPGATAAVVVVIQDDATKATASTSLFVARAGDSRELY